jgi:hypothetical protein
MTYSEILARLETATGPDREIDCMIGHAIDFKVEGMSFRQYADRRKQDWATIAEICAPGLGAVLVRYLPTYTASLDAVVALIESELPGWWWQVRSLAGGKFTAAAAESPRPERQGKGSFGLTPPLALLTAAIRALADKEAA